MSTVTGRQSILYDTTYTPETRKKALEMTLDRTNVMRKTFVSSKRELLSSRVSEEKTDSDKSSMTSIPSMIQQWLEREEQILESFKRSPGFDKRRDSFLEERSRLTSAVYSLCCKSSDS